MEQAIKEVIDDRTQTIPLTAAVVSKAVFNGQRKVLSLMNTSLAGEIISIGILNQAKAGQGIVLNPGDRYVESIDAGYSPSNEQVTAIASVATATLAVHEVITLN